MKKTLVIVESPAKIKKIESFLGNKYKVIASYGHINNLGKNKKDLGIDINDNYNPSYYILSDKFKVINKIREEAKKSKDIILASDKDSEGEAIAYHLCNLLNLNINNTKRIIFNSITKDEILNAINNPTTINMNLVKSQQTRQIIDKLIGYSISPTLWKKIGNSLSAGRCQSPALQLLYDRENDIQNIDQSTHFKINAYLYNDNIDQIYTLLSNNINNKKDLLTFFDNCKNNSTFTLSNIKKNKNSTKSPLPFITSTLQQECYNKFNMSSKNTMNIAQKLYEKGFITYHRTDSTILSNDAFSQIKDYIIQNYGQNYFLSKNNKNKNNGSKIQEAHECIRPVNINNISIQSTNNYEKKVYNIIWKRTIASQMANLDKMIFNVFFDIINDKKQFIAKFEQILFDGYTKVYSLQNKNFDIIPDKEDTNSIDIIDKLNINDVFYYNTINANQKFDKSINHYSESSLIKELEKKGIGRPSTYSNIIDSITKRNYAIKDSKEGTPINVQNYKLQNNILSTIDDTILFGKENNKLYITDLGKITTDFLIHNFPDLMNYDYTSKIESDLDKVESGSKIWHNVIHDYYTKIEPQVNFLKQSSKNTKFKKVLGKNDNTGDEISIIVGKYGPVIKSGCYKDAQNCKFAKIKEGQNIQSTSIDDAKQQLAFPLNVGTFKNKDIIIKNGPYGYYISYNKKNYNIKSNDISDFKIKDYIDIINNNNSNIIKEFKDFKIINGSYGPYIHNLNDKSKKKFFKIPIQFDPKKLSLDNIKNIIYNSS